MDVALKKCAEWLGEYSSQKQEIIATYLFGSILEGEENPQDIDVAFLINSRNSVNSFEKSIEYSAELAQKVGYDDFDVVILNNSPLAFRNDIFSKGKLIYSSDETQRMEFEAFSWREYSNFKHYLSQYDEYMSKRWANKGGQEMFNKEIVFQRANVCESALNKLSHLKKLSEADFLANSQHVALAEHFLRLSIDSLIDLATHIIAVKGLGRPGSPRDIIHLLAQTKTLPQDFVQQGIKLVKLRDKLIHLYWEVEATEIYQVLNKELESIGKFLNYLLQTVEEGIESETED